MLDAACGIGVDAASLDRRGFQVTATDASPAMVGRCRERLADQAPNVEVDVCAWSDLPGRFGPEFDAVLCLGNSLSHAPSSGARRAALTGFAAVLAPNGTLLLDLQDWAVVYERGSWHDDDPLVVSRDGVECRRSYDWRVPDRFGDPLVLEITLRVQAAGDERQSCHSMTFLPFAREMLLADLEATGFVDVTVVQVPGDDRLAVTARCSTSSP